MPHVLTIDFEGWAQKTHRIVTGEVRPLGAEALERQTDRWLDLLARRGVRATFFVLGMTAEAWPHLVERIRDAGHELGVHGYAHDRVDEASPAAFRADVARALEIVTSLAGRRPQGFRAAEFSIGRSSLYALDALADLGFTYDSSIFPIAHRRYGIPNWPRTPSRVAGGRLVELPLATVGLGPLRVPVAGGGYWRVLPERAIQAALDGLARAGESAVLYFHPVEMAIERPTLDVAALPFPQRAHAERLRWRQTPLLGGVAAKLEAVLPRFDWMTAADLAASVA